MTAATPTHRHRAPTAALFDTPDDAPSRVDPEVRGAAYDAAAAAAAVLITGGAKYDFASLGGYPDGEKVREALADAQPALDSLLEACAARAPALVADARAVLPLARLAVWFPPERHVRPLAEWDGAFTSTDGEASLRSLTRHLLETWETPEVLHGALDFSGEQRAAAVPEAAHRVAYAFSLAQAAAGSGAANVRDALNGALSTEEVPVVSKAVAKRFVASETAGGAAAATGRSALHALRRAQVEAQGAPAWVADGVCRSRLGERLLGAGVGPVAADGFAEGASEGVALAAINWVCTHAEALGEPHEVATAVDFALEMRKQEPGYSLAGRTPKTVRAAMDQYAQTSVKFDSDEMFEPNPRGIKGLFATDATIPEGTRVHVPYDDAYNGGPDDGYACGAGTARGARPCTVAITEISSLRRLIYEGKQLNNCLETKFDSQVKYVMRARQRVSSFWSLTFTYPDEREPVYALLAEVWHLREGNIIRQAEGPRPRTLPGPEAWYWLDQWCTREDINLETWDVYSRVQAPIIPPPPL